MGHRKNKMSFSQGFVNISEICRETDILYFMKSAGVQLINAV